MSEHAADGPLIDVSEVGLSELLDEVDETSLERALQRILASGDESVVQYGFQNSI